MTKRLSWTLCTQLQGMADHIGVHFLVYAEGNGARTKTVTFFRVLERNSSFHGMLNLPSASNNLSSLHSGP